MTNGAQHAAADTPGLTAGTSVYAAFISYSHADKSTAEWLHKRLESYRTPSALIGREGPGGRVGKRLGKVFRDRADLSATPDLHTEIRLALEQAQALVVLCSPSSAASRYVQEEICYFKKLGKGHRIFAAIVDGEPFAARKPGRNAAEECFPPALVFRLAADGTLSAEPEPTEPIAADLRPGKDGRENGSLKIIAGLIGVGLDELVQREKQAERQRRLRANAIAAAMTVLALSAAGAGIVAWLQRNVAEERRIEADEQRDRARNALAQIFADAARAESDRGAYDQALRLGIYALRSSELKSDAARIQIVRAAYANRLAGRYELASDWDPAYVLNSERHAESLMSFRFVGMLSAAGERLAGVSAVETRSHLWDVVTGQLLATAEHEWNETMTGFDRGVFATSGRALFECAQDAAAQDEDEDDSLAPAIAFDAPPLATASDVRSDPSGSCEGALQLIDGMTRGRGSLGFEYENTRLGTLAQLVDQDEALQARLGMDAFLRKKFMFSAVAVSPDGRRVAAGFKEGTLAILEFASDIRDVRPGGLQAALQAVEVLGHHTGRIDSLNFSGDMSLLTSTAMDGLAKIWRIRHAPGPAAEGVGAWSQPGTLVAVRESRRFVISLESEGEFGAEAISVSDRATGRRIGGLEDSNIRVWGFSPDESLVLVSAGFIEGGNVSLLSTATGEKVATYDVPYGLVESAVFSPDGRQFAAGVENAVMVWSTDPRRGLLATLEISPLSNIDTEGDSGRRGVEYLAFSPDGRLIASGSELGLQLWAWSDSALVAATQRPIAGGVRFSGNTRIEFGVKREAGEPEAVSWSLDLLGLTPEELLTHVCGGDFVPTQLHPSARTFSLTEARSDRLVRRIWLNAEGKRIDVCGSKLDLVED